MIRTVAASILFLALSASAKEVKLCGRVEGVSGRHSVRVALWKEHDFLIKPYREVSISKGNEPSFTFTAETGTWALSAYEDRNENNSLDMGMLGPKERAGFWPPFQKWRKPHFSDVAFTLDRDTCDIVLRIK